MLLEEIHNRNTDGDGISGTIYLSWANTVSNSISKWKEIWRSINNYKVNPAEINNFFGDLAIIMANHFLIWLAICVAKLKTCTINYSW